MLRFGANNPLVHSDRSIDLRTNFANSSSTDFLVSKADDRRLLANTSGDTSLKIWFVARRRRTRADHIMSTVCNTP
jgi:hypothetical protein